MSENENKIGSALTDVVDTWLTASEDDDDMLRFSVSATTTAAATVNVRLTRKDLEELRDAETGELDESRLRELVEDAAFEQGFPTLCAHCAGWGKQHSIELGDEWEVEAPHSSDGPYDGAVRLARDQGDVD